jgi:deazaflavin-dependent oxidoreductase (nitroreductase family)
MTSQPRSNPPTFNSPVGRLALKAQTFLLRRNWMGPAGNFLMVITTTGRKSGRQFSVPIGYLRDGETVVAFNLGGGSNWYKNMLHTPRVTLTIKGTAGDYHGAPVQDNAEIVRILDLYKREARNVFERFFGVSPDQPTEEIAKSPDLRVVFVRFRLAR